MSADNLDAAQALIGQIDILTDAEGPVELIGPNRAALTLDVAVNVAVARALVDIARSLRGIELVLNEHPPGGRPPRL